MFSLKVLEIKFDFSHVYINISRRHDGFRCRDHLLAVIDTDQYDGYLRFQGDIIKTLFPIWICLAGSFGRDSQMKLFAFVEMFDHLIHQRSFPTTVYGNPADCFEKKSEWKEKPFFLHHETSLTTLCTVK